MPKDPEFRAALRNWFSRQTKYKNLREVASGTGMPFNTLRGYFSGKLPKHKNLRLLIEATGLELNFKNQARKPNNPKFPGQDLAPERPNLKARTYARRLLGELQFDLARCIASIPAVQAALSEGVPSAITSAPARSGRQIQILMDALERSLSGIIRDPKTLELARKSISGSDAGYLSGLLGALFDDRRLQTWQQMTTYKYGSK